MQLEDAKFIWMANDEELFGTNPNQGRFLVVTREEDDENLPNSFGCIEHDWNEADHAGRLELLESHLAVVIHHDRISKEVILNELKKIDDINPLQVDLDKTPDDED
ncbi:hypothetical protein [Rhizobium sp. Leaf383]|uniref:hypothetical protein n=1 Tax=Rhizobium sp. Leaf383 TaxID=1736357 RepID=UPI00071453E6|nr:hypothetical protein [Rhizobium sp. Leaf383]KQS84267.1 hypothetical protein ASG58_21085 [Rhizobium sp. Leaf383]